LEELLVDLGSIRTSTLPAILILLTLIPTVMSTDLKQVFVTPIDCDTTPWSTANSNKQMIVENENGIFMVYN